MCLIPGILGFAACCIFDLNKVYWRSKHLNHLFILGSLLLVLSTLWTVSQCSFSLLADTFGIAHVIYLLGMILSGITLIYVLFFALPFESTYEKTETLPVINSGIYALCRHPGFWPFLFFYLFMWLFLSNPLVGIAAIVYSICNLIYIFIQDHYIFPLYIQGYNEYKQTVPFLIPNQKSIKHFFAQPKL